MEDSVTKHQSVSRANEYPDLDYTPNYPWAGTLNRPDQPAYYTGSSENLEYSPRGEGTGYDLYDARAEETTGLEEAVAIADKRMHAADATASYDIELPEDNSSESYEVSSEAESDIDSEELNGGLSVGYNDRGRRGRSYSNRNAQGRKNFKRGLRKPLEPSLEFKAFHSNATMAFIAHEYEEAEQFALQAILCNPEMFAAHSLLSEIHMACGDKTKALAALFNGAHTRPRDIQVWLKLAQWIVERAGDDKLSATRDAIYCYSRILTVDKTYTMARHKRAAMYRDSGHLARAAYDYEYLLKQFPNNTTILRCLAEIYIDLGEAHRALSHYDRSFNHYRLKELEEPSTITWSDINIYCELYGFEQKYQEGISQIKSLSRWFLGRGSDEFWNSYDQDDREWDSEDQPRRFQVEGFRPGQFQSSAYGNGLPLELRIKLGIYRLNLGTDHQDEAMNHFGWLNLNESEIGFKLFDYPDLFREVADCLCRGGLHEKALKFYKPLQQVTDYTDYSYFADMVTCFKALGLDSEAKDCCTKLIEISEKYPVEGRQITAICKELGIPGKGGLKQSTEISNPKPASFTMIAPRLRRRLTKTAVLDREIEEKIKNDNSSILFKRMQTLIGEARTEGIESRSQWMESAKLLIEDFQSEKVFFPSERFMRFYGFSKEARKKSMTSKNEQYPAKEPEQYNLSTEENLEEIPTKFRTITFDAWLDIFLEYALMLALENEAQNGYEIISSALNANVFYHSPDSMFLIHVCWFTCALIAKDEETLCNVARWFMKEFQFVTDGYRLFSALNRLCDTSNTWYNCGPSQKYILRQVKAMDFSLVGKTRKQSHFQEKAPYTTKGKDGNPLPASDLDIGLLMLYGHILYAGKSYAFSINYFLRAFAIDPENPIINLSLALAYIHYAIKRQADNRHHLIMQGFAFLFSYYNMRQGSQSALERQEANYNVGRAYHMLGLTHLAIPYYSRCLDRCFDRQEADNEENFVREAALALQGIWAASGNMEKAREVTQEWLVY